MPSMRQPSKLQQCTGLQAAMELVAERLHNIDRKRWLLAQNAGQVRLKNSFEVKSWSKHFIAITFPMAHHYCIVDTSVHDQEILKK